MRANSRFERAMAFYDRAAHFSSIADHRKADDARNLRSDLNEIADAIDAGFSEVKRERGRIEFKSAGATRKRS